MNVEYRDIHTTIVMTTQYEPDQAALTVRYCVPHCTHAG